MGNQASENRLRRLRVLQCLYTLRGQGHLADEIVREWVDTHDPDRSPTLDEIHATLEYLHSLGFISVLKDHDTIRLAMINYQGVDYLEGTDPGLPGIHHPDDFGCAEGTAHA